MNIPIKNLRIDPSNRIKSFDSYEERIKKVMDSIKERGMINPIQVKKVSTNSIENIYDVVDGVIRVYAHVDLGIKNIRCHVIGG